MPKLPIVSLIIPPSIFLLDERVFMNLGILKVAAVLEKAGYPVEVLDFSGIENYEEALRDHCRTTESRIFGVTSTTPQMPAAMKIAHAIRRELPMARLVLGGPHATLVHTAFIREQKENREARATRTLRSLEEAFDVLVIGDGEEAIFEALRNDPPKIVDANSKQSSLFLTNQKLEELPFPARHLIDIDSYHYQIEGHRAISIIAQLGCPFACGFCGGRMSPSLRVIRTRSSDNIIEELRMLHETYGFTGFMFYDDELNVNKNMVELMNGISKLQKDLGTEFRLRGFVKSELFNDEQAEAMYRAGFRWLLTGFESGSPQILTNINKKATRDENTRAVSIAKRHGLKVKALMSIGHPGESEKTVLETRDWLLEVKPDDFDVTIITTYPGTPYYDEALPHPTQKGIWIYTYQKSGDKLYSYEVDYNKVADYYKGDPDGGYKAYVYTDHLNAEELVKVRDFVERDVRQKLGIPFNPGAPAIRYEHSMGQFGKGLPSNILRTSGVKNEKSQISVSKYATG
ncbi:MAG: B12-binding domain-containing radical SAM protein [Candidatus Omnitrophica bacterium]|nr:B12-binding domain-containing radical SAM protein [Candidatus Omnitrophota bacterium]